MNELNDPLNAFWEAKKRLQIARSKAFYVGQHVKLEIAKVENGIIGAIGTVQCLPTDAVDMVSVLRSDGREFLYFLSDCTPLSDVSKMGLELLKWVKKTNREKDMDTIRDALCDGHPNPEAYLEWCNSLPDERITEIAAKVRSS